MLIASFVWQINDYVEDLQLEQMKILTRDYKVDILWCGESTSHPWTALQQKLTSTVLSLPFVQTVSRPLSEYVITSRG